MRPKINMQPLGNMSSRARPVRVKSSTNKGNDHLLGEGYIDESVAGVVNEIEDTLTGVEKHVIQNYWNTGDESALDVYFEE